MDLRQIWTLYRHEIRSALRERSILLTSIILPVVMYPTLLWVGFTGFYFLEGQAEAMSTRIGVTSVPEVHEPLVDSLAANPRIEILEWTDDERAAAAEIVRGRMEALLEPMPPRDAGEALDGNRTIRILYTEVREGSRSARARIEDVTNAHGADWITEIRRDLGVSDTVWADYAVVMSDQASAEDVTRFLLAMIVPLLTLIMVALAAFYPAIDATAGERERGTWETLMTVAAPRSTVATAKYLYVATFGAVGGLLNLAALALSIRWILSPMTNGVGEELSQGGVPLSAIPVILAGTALLGLFVAAGMLVFAVFARDFKEGQSMITPFYIVILMPALFLQSPNLEFTTGLAAVPIVNVALLLRGAILGDIPFLSGLVTLISMGMAVIAAVALAQFVMRREEVLLGSGQGGLWNFLTRTLRQGRNGS
ncbi:MAG: ABC transporter permease [Gemmatimonadales bacterium]|nr:MAG: ABC transporter permease [Gemmatimonadales bacterium]